MIMPRLGAPLQPVAANCTDIGNQVAHMAHISHARKRAMTRILTLAFINANGNDLKWSRSRFNRRCQCQVYCQWHNLSLLFRYLSEFGSQPGDEVLSFEHLGEIKYEVFYKYRGERCDLFSITELEIILK